MNSLNLETVYSHVQKMFAPGLTTVIGSGLSCAYGLPGMGALATGLLSSMPLLLQKAGLPDASWSVVAGRLAQGTGLETALDGLDSDDPIMPFVVSLTADIVLSAERKAVAQMLASSSACAIGKLMTYITTSNPTANVITTNYDRLIEVACALAKIPVDTGFRGNTLGYYDEAASREQIATARRPGRRQGTNAKKNHIRISKPHGSLDWYDYIGQPVRSEMDMDCRRLMITPGLSKYKSGYQPPFDAQKNRATKAIDGASSLLFLGYGFNDDHLQTHLSPQLGRGARATIITQELTDSALKYTDEFPEILALDAWPDEPFSTRIRMNSETMKVEGIALWNLDVLIPEVIAR